MSWPLPFSSGEGPGQDAKGETVSGMQVVRVRGGWAVRFENGDQTPAMTKQAASEHGGRVREQRARFAAAEADEESRTARLLERNGIGPVDFRDLKPGDLFTWRPEVSPAAATRVEHFPNGASLIDRPGTSCGCILMTPGHQAYGRHFQ